MTQAKRTPLEVELLEALRAQEDAETKNANCKECEGEGNWAECEPCTKIFNEAIDLRNAAIAKAEGKS
jgi:hypothetical protein